MRSINENPRTLFTVAAGNTVPSGVGPNSVPAPASAYNNFTVAAVGPNGGAYDLPSYFTNGGPNDYYDPVNGTVSAVRQVVDIAAPGENFSTAYYGGQTGGNGPAVFGPANGPAGGPNWYSRNVNGTSFAAPTVAGGAALLVRRRLRRARLNARRPRLARDESRAHELGRQNARLGQRPNRQPQLASAACSPLAVWMTAWAPAGWTSTGRSINSSAARRTSPACRKGRWATSTRSAGISARWAKESPTTI